MKKKNSTTEKKNKKSKPQISEINNTKILY